MSNPQVIPTRAPEGGPRPPRLLRTLSMVGIGLIIAGGLLVLIVMHVGHPQPLAQVTLEDGSILQLWAITTGTNHEFVLDRGSEIPFLPMGSAHPRRTAEAGFGWEHMIVWLGRVDAETGQPLDLDWFSHCVAVDANGWKNPSTMAGRVHLIENAPQVLEQGLLRDVPPFSSLPEADYEKIIVGAVLDVALTEQFTLQVYDTKGRCVAELPAESPVPEKSDELTPQPLPATLSDGDLSVTLKGVGVERAADSPVGGTSLKLKPDVEFSWRGEDDGDWTYYDREILAVTDPIGNMGFLNHCTLSPHQPWWKLGFLLRRTADADFDDDQIWSSGALDIPPSGESRTLDLDQTLEGIHVRLVSIHGPGSIRFSTTLPDCGGAISPPASDSGEGWTAQAVHHVGGAEWAVESTGPVLVYEFIDADMGRNLVFLRAKTDTGQSVAVDQASDFLWKNRKTLIAILPGCPGDAHAVTVDLILDEYRSVEFVIEPPAVDVDRLTTSPSTGDGEQTL